MYYNVLKLRSIQRISIMNISMSLEDVLQVELNMPLFKYVYKYVNVSYVKSAYMYVEITVTYL